MFTFKKLKSKKWHDDNGTIERYCEVCGKDIFITNDECVESSGTDFWICSKGCFHKMLQNNSDMLDIKKSYR